MKKNRIAFFIYSFDGGGGPQCTIDIADGLSRMGYQVDFLVVDGSSSDSELTSDLTKITYLTKNKKTGIISFFVFLHAIHRFVRINKPDVCFNSGGNYLGILLSLISLSFFNASKFVFISHCMITNPGTSLVERNLRKIIAKMTFFFMDKIVSVSDGMKNDISSSRLAKKSKLLTIYNPLRNLSHDSKSRNKTVKNLINILSAGRLEPVKDYESLIKAFSIIINRGVNAKLTIIGEGTQRDSLKNLIINLGLIHRISLPGRTNNPSFFYEGSDIFVLSSLNEGFGLVLVEALHFGLTIVSTDCKSGPREVLSNGRFGYLVPPDNIEALASALEHSILNRLDPMLLKARASDFSSSMIASKYHSLIQSLLIK